MAGDGGTGGEREGLGDSVERPFLFRAQMLEGD